MDASFIAQMAGHFACLDCGGEEFAGHTIATDTAPSSEYRSDVTRKLIMPPIGVRVILRDFR